PEQVEVRFRALAERVVEPHDVAVAVKLIQRGQRIAPPAEEPAHELPAARARRLPHAHVRLRRADGCGFLRLAIAAPSAAAFTPSVNSIKAEPNKCGPTAAGSANHWAPSPMSRASTIVARSRAGIGATTSRSRSCC